MNHSKFTIHNSQSSPSFLSPFTAYPLPSTICLLLIIAFALFFGAVAVQQHRAFQTNGLDLGNVDQALWNTAHGRWFQFTLMTPLQSRLALHVEPILLLLLPLYWLNLGGPAALLAIQAAVVALGAWPLYQIALRNSPFTINYSSQQPLSSSTLHLLSASLCLIFPLTYLLLPTLESAVLFDFHAVTLAPTWLLFAFLALEQGHNRRFLGYCLLALACKEDMPLVVATLGLYAGLAQRRWRLAGLIIIPSAIWFMVAFFVVQPRFAAGGNIQLERYAWLGDNPLAMLQTLLTQPALVFNHVWVQADLPGYLTRLFFPTAFVALLSPLTLLPLLPPLAINLLSDNPFTWRLEDFHYGAPLAPFLFISTIYGMRRMSEWVNEPLGVAKVPVAGRHSLFRHSPIRHSPIHFFALLLLACSLSYHYYRGFTPLALPFAWPAVTPHHQRLAKVLATLPPDLPVFAQSNLAPHLTQRQIIYTDYAYFTDPNYPAPTPATDILLDVTAFENSGGLHQFLRQRLLESGAYHVVLAEDGILHLHRTKDEGLTTNNAPPPPTSRFASLLPTPFYAFTQPDSPPQYPLSVDFAGAIRLHGYSLHFNRQEEVQVSVDLEALQPLTSTPQIQPVLFLLDQSGQPQGATTDLQPALVWYPPSQWPVGEVVRVRFNTLPWYTRNTPAYRLALGLVNGPDVWHSPRLRPSLSQPTDLAVRLPADGTMVELARIVQVWDMPGGGPVMRQFTVPQPTQPRQANFNRQIKLLDYRTPQLSNLQSPISNYQITLTWQALTTPPNLARFVQLIGPDGHIYSQNDAAPDRGQYPTFLWQPGEVVIETITLPLSPDRPAGNYTWHIGLYYPDTGARLPLTSGGDHLEIEVN